MSKDTILTKLKSKTRELQGLRDKFNSLKGQQEVLLKTLKEKFKVNTVQEAEVFLEKKEKELEKKEKEASELVQEMEEIIEKCESRD